MIRIVCPKCKSLDVMLAEDRDELLTTFPQAIEVYCGNCGWNGNFERKNSDTPMLKETSK